MSARLDWLAERPEVTSVRSVVADLNGQARGKRVPASYAQSLFDGGARMPLSALNLDIRGEDIEDSPLVFESGDRDGTLLPTERGFVPMPWLAAPSALLPMAMYSDDGAPFPGDPRHALAAVLTRYADRGWQPVSATELEFTLVDASGDTLQPPASPGTGARAEGGEILSLAALDGFAAFFDDLYAGAEAMGLPAGAATSESGLGQFEVTLGHGPAMKAADDAFLFKMLVKGLAGKHGLTATFMAKPYAEDAGNGLHTHISVLDAQGRNVFDDGTPRGTDTLLAAIAGCLRALPDSTALFAPHGNSYARFVPGAHAPTGIAWAYENRTVAIRVPGGSAKARRLEHRVAGGDVNPYLFLAAILGAALTGIEDGLTPPDPITGNAYAQDLPQIPATWDDALARFEGSRLLPRIFPDALLRNFALTKRQEMRIWAAADEAARLRLYLDTA